MSGGMAHRWATFFWRDLVFPAAGAYLLLISPGAAHLAAWQAPIILLLLGTPVVGRGSESESEGGEDAPE